jgi:hypothetical protein
LNDRLALLPTVSATLQNVDMSPVIQGSLSFVSSLMRFDLGDKLSASLLPNVSLYSFAS